LDGSELAENALAPARAVARHCQTELRLVRVATPPPRFVTADVGYGALYLDPRLEEARQGAERYLAQLQAAWPDDDLRLQLEASDGDVPGVLVDAARQSQARLLVMSSHGDSGVKRWLRGSVAEKVLDAAPCPVWMVRAPTPPRHILITLDGSKLAEAVLPPALTLAHCFGAQVSLLRVVPDLAAADIRALDECERGMGRRWVDETREEAASYLERVADRGRAEGLAVQTAVRSGSAAEAILAYAEQSTVDLVAMTTHGRTGLRRWLYGSVTHKVLDQLGVSMLVARSAEHDLD
jgi:nucleotide-binding universal stress UspA family protein